MPLDTLAAPATHALEIKHSRFVAHAAPIENEDGAMRVLRDVHVPDATHNCWAWRVGDQYRSSDDGEPAGTAGRPILAAIDGQGFDRIAVVVVRWYGGIKLGAGGLVRAYGGCAAECLRTAARQPLVDLARVVLRAPFDALGTLLGVGLMILPAGIARFWSRDITTMICIAVASAIVSGYAGLVLSYQTRIPSGPAIILVAAGLYIVSLLFGNVSGLVRQLFPGRHLEA